MISATFPARSATPAALRPAVDREPDVTVLLLRWQSSGDRAAFAALAAAVTPTIEAVAAAELRRRGLHDATLVAEAATLVLDHLRRLHEVGADEETVSPFRPAPGCGPAAGLVYVRWLARRRACDLSRSQRRRDRHEPTFTRCFGGACEPDRVAAATPGIRPATVPPSAEQTLQSLGAAARRLDEAERDLAQSLLAGTPQVEIARRLGISAGTVTRRRQRLLARMGGHLRDDGEVGPLGPVPGPGPGAATGPTLVSFDLVAQAHDTLEFPLPRSVHALYLHTQGQVVHALLRAGVRRTIDRRPGSLALFAAGSAPAVIQARPDEPTAGILVIIPPEVVATTCRNGAAGDRGSLANTTEDTIEENVDFRDPCLERLLGRLREAAADKGEPPADDSPSLAILERLLSRRDAAFTRAADTVSRLTRAEQRLLLEWIDGHLDRPLALEELAALFRLSVGHFARKVRNTFRMCPSHVVQQRRALAAIALMRDRERSLATLAAQLGFSSQSHFTTMFRRHVGMTPAVFRQKVHGLAPAGGGRGISPVADFRAQGDSRPGVETVCGYPAAAGAGRQA
jgi:RNA polymerase sigma factor (sigma-70 family)